MSRGVVLALGVIAMARLFMVFRLNKELPRLESLKKFCIPTFYVQGSSIDAYLFYFGKLSCELVDEGASLLALERLIYEHRATLVTAAPFSQTRMPGWMTGGFQPSAAVHSTLSLGIQLRFGTRSGSSLGPVFMASHGLPTWSLTAPRRAISRF